MKILRNNLQKSQQWRVEAVNPLFAPWQLNTHSSSTSVPMMCESMSRSGRVRHDPPIDRAEREPPLQMLDCHRHGDDSRNDNGTPAQPQSQTMGGGSVRTAVGVKLP